MRKRQKPEGQRLSISLFSPDIPPGAPPDFVPPTAAELLDRLSVLSAANPTIPPPPPPPSNFLERLRALASGETLPIPTALPTIEVLPTVGDVSEAPRPTAQADLTALMRYDEPLGFGIGKALKYISSHGILVEHRGEEEPLLEYVDEFGMRISGKDAFQHQSHIFSGKKAGEKQARKALVKHRAEERKANAEIGDTPLKTASALRKTLAQKQSAFIELSGENRTVLPYEPLAENPEKQRANRKKRLRLKQRRKEKPGDDEE